MSQDLVKKIRNPARRSRDEKTEMEVSQLLSLLSTGSMTIMELVPWSSNYTFLVTLSKGEDQALAIYKPSRGERPLWDFPTGTLAKRECAAYLVSATLGWPNVPPTVLRDGPQGIGAVQLFIDAVDGEHYFTLRDKHRDEMRRIAIFDAVINNTDRKGGHVLLGKDGAIWCIDHGVTFHEHPKLRTVIWDFTRESIPPAVMDDLRALKTSVSLPAPLAQSLAPLLSRREIDALCGRTQELLVRGVFPDPPEDWPHIPWPPI